MRRWRRLFGNKLPISLYEPPQHLLDLWKRDCPELMRQVKEDLDHIHETGRLRPSDLQLYIQLSPFDTSVHPLLGYEGGEFDPKRRGAARIVVPPTEGRGSNSKGSWRLEQVSAPFSRDLPALAPPLPLSIQIEKVECLEQVYPPPFTA